MEHSPALVWFRRDLRLADNPAFAAAVNSNPVAAVYVLDEASPGSRPFGGATRWWLHQSLQELASSLEQRGIPLILKRGPAQACVSSTAREVGAAAVMWNRRYDAAGITCDKAVADKLKTDGVAVNTFNAGLLNEPGRVVTKDGQPYRVFTPYYRAAMAMGSPPAPLATPKNVTGYAGKVTSEHLADWALQPSAPDWAGGLRESWKPGEDGAQQALDRFLGCPVDDYKTARDIPGVMGTSRLSPHLTFGEIGPRQIWAALNAHPPSADTETFLKELIWREFCTQLLHANPDMETKPLRPEFAAFPWRKKGHKADRDLRAWQQGRTGYPIVDAGMRELWATGYMHNRVRMITASFLVKHLLLPWQAGEAWFWDTLTDADFANNIANWQWVAGSGADAAPYFRIFNPVTQGERFDSNGAYVRRWVPELARLPDRVLHKPWTAGAAALKNAGVILGKTYPEPVVDHTAARARALAAFAEIKKS